MNETSAPNSPSNDVALGARRGQSVMSVRAIWGCEAGPRRANFGDDNVTEPKRPYFNAEAAAARRRVLCLPAETMPQHIKTVAVGFGRNGIYLVQRPSDATMKQLNNELKSAQRI